jgi:RNA polymerase sigma factor (sigma-70 family)
MADSGLHGAVEFIRQIAGPGREDDLADGELLRRFIERRDEAAFAALVRRHGALVLGVCRRVLPNRADSEDAFQATFLVLVRKARSICKRPSVGSWLYGVAYRVAVRAREDGARRRARERQAERAPAPDALQELVWRDLRAVLDEEVLRLPGRCRAPFLLCYLEGRTTEEAAALLRCPRGTVLSRLARARELLRGRLARRGLCLSGGLLAALLARQAAEAAVAPALAAAARHAALAAAAGNAGRAGAAPARHELLAEGVVQAMRTARARAAGALLLAVGLLAGGGVMLARPAPANRAPRAASEGAAAPAPAAALADVALAWGKPESGLRVGAQILEANRAGKVGLSVVLENVGKDDVVVNLGIMLGNGRTQLPTAVRLVLTDAARRTRVLQRKVGGVAGRVDPFVVPLPAGGRLTLPCVLEDYADADPAQLGTPLAPGRYHTKAEFVGKTVARADTNRDMVGLALMKYWTGTVRSGEVVVTVPAPRR